MQALNKKSPVIVYGYRAFFIYGAKAGATRSIIYYIILISYIYYKNKIFNIPAFVPAFHGDETRNVKNTYVLTTS